MTKIAIIGAGPMGLATAYYLTEKGVAPTIFEADDRVGGMSASFDFNGITLEKYYHFINRPDEYLFKLLKSLNIYDSLVWKQTQMGFFKKNKDGNLKLYEWGNPIALLKFKNAPLITRFRYGLHVFRCKFYKNLDNLDDIKSSDWIRFWEGKKGYELFWKSLFEKKFFEHSDNLSAAWIASRIRRVANSRDSIMHESLGYLEGGTQILLDKLQNEIIQRGGVIHLNTPVSTIETEPGKKGGTITRENKTTYYDVIISTIPLPYVSKIFSYLPQNYLTKLEKIINIGCVCAVFQLKEKLTENFWLNIDVDSWDIPGVIEYSNLRTLPYSCVYIPFYCPHSHPNWKMDNAGFIQKARTYLKTINSVAAESEVSSAAFRYEFAQPVCPPGFRNMLPPIQTGIDGVFAADTSHSYYEDRSINESVKIGTILSNLALKIR
jgi:protoporphyrinogen oxidase